MNWNSPAEFFAMGGYGLYVWGSAIVTFVIMVVEPMLAQQRQRNILRTLRRERIAQELDKS